jgi:adenylosuccinate synthase
MVPRYSATEGGIWCVFDPILGDNGKGRIVDHLLGNEKVTFGVRYNGGGNAGHSVVKGEEQIALHALPSSLVRAAEREVMSMMGRGMVINLTALFKEIAGLEKHGIHVTPENLIISEGAQLTLPYHLALELAAESGANKNDTTKKAISQTYGFAKMYMGIRAGDVRDLAWCAKQIVKPLSWANAILVGVYDQSPITTDEVMAELEAHRDRLMPFLGDESLEITRRLENGEIGIAEGAQSGGLCPDNGIYPYTTASSSWPCSIQTGAGVDPAWITRKIAVIKAYITRVGLNGKTSQMEEAIEELVAQRGHEFGVTSGRRRTCLWPDDTWARKCARISGATELAINKTDVLTGIDPIKICIGYRLPDGRVIDDQPIPAFELAQCSPVYIQMPGWDQDITGVTDWEDLPDNCQKFLERIAEPYNAELSFVGTGPERDQIIVL